MSSLLCVLILLSTLVSSGGAYGNDPETRQREESSKISDAVVRLSDGRTISCNWGDWGRCSRSRRSSSKKCFRKSKICTQRGKGCRMICVMDPYDAWDTCSTNRYCRDKWGLSRKSE